MEEAELEASEREKEDEQLVLPEQPFLSGLVGFAFHGATLALVFILAIFLWFELGMIQMAIESQSGSVFEQFGSVILRMLAASVGLVCLLTFAKAMLIVVQDSASGVARLQSMPAFNLADWAVESLFLVSPLFFAIFPGIVLGQLLSTFGTPGWLSNGMAALLVFCGIVFLFPIMLLSTLESGSMVGFVSRPIMQSLRYAGRYWRAFYFQASVLFLLLWVLVTMRVKLATQSGFLNFLIAYLFVHLCVVYFRQIGRLAWSCQEALSEVDTEQLAVEDESDA